VASIRRATRPEWVGFFDPVQPLLFVASLLTPVPNLNTRLVLKETLRYIAVFAVIVCPSKESKVATWMRIALSSGVPDEALSR
jgi:hypothetical protein